METCDTTIETPTGNGIYINGIKYSYIIGKSDNNNEELNIKLYDKTKNSNIYFKYESQFGDVEKIMQLVPLCKNVNDVIDYFKKIFSEEKAKIEEKNERFIIVFKINNKDNIAIPLTKYKTDYDIDNRINKLEKNYNILSNRFDELIINKDKELKNAIEEIIFGKDIKNKLFEEFEHIFLTKYNINKTSKEKNENIEQNIINKMKEEINKQENKLNKEITLLKHQINESIEYLNKIKSDKKNNYITLQIKIDENNVNKDIILFNQVRTYKYFCNFERDDIETIIDNKMVSINFKNSYEDFKYDKNSKNCEQSQKIFYNLNIKYKYYWNFAQTGLHTVKIIFKKKLLQSKYLFYDCDSIYKIDCSNFDCSQIINCSGMFYHCSSLKEINLGELDFNLSYSFSQMFYNCKNLENIDISKFNTKYAQSFNSMFKDCSKLKKINVNNFRAKNCKDISEMFSNCKSLESIDMLNWDMKNISYIENLFSGCLNLKNIKMNLDKEYNKLKDAFYGLPDNGTFIGKKGVGCDKILQYLPKGWKKLEE